MKIGQRLRIKWFLRKTVNERPFLSKNPFKKVPQTKQKPFHDKAETMCSTGQQRSPFGSEKEQTKNQPTKKNPTQKGKENTTYLETMFFATVF